ncbi:13767_t:CDS:2 [Entrophospora sp. SA101]|nr:13767_t:CDS:2 [Entrophospora sp. SA101]
MLYLNEPLYEQFTLMLPNGNNFLTNEYVHIEDENVWTGLTDEDIIEMVNQKEEISEEEQEPEFGEVKFK